MYNSEREEYHNYHYDNIGSTTLISGPAGKVIERFTYGTYGELLREVASGIWFLYNGSYGVVTDENGRYYMRARYYNSDIKRFINRDIKVGDIGSSQSLNRYAYCEGNPVSLVDPFGLSPQNTNNTGFKWTIHDTLDALGVFWDGADLINAGLYALEGEWGKVALSAVAIIPIVGSAVVGAAKSAKTVIKAKKIASLEAEASEMTKKVSNTTDVVYDTMRSVSKWGDNPLKIVDGIATEAGTKAMKALETGGDFAKESKKAVWEMKAAVGADGIRLSTTAEESASLLKRGLAGTDGISGRVKSVKKKPLLRLKFCQI